MANINKIKQLTAFRSEEISKLYELKLLSERISDEVTLRPLFEIRCKLSLENIFNEFQKHHKNLISLLAVTEEFNLEEHLNICRDFENDYYLIQTAYVNQLESKTPTPSASNEKEGTQNSHIKLPKINLLEFSGDIKNWKPFIDMFNVTIHENTNLNDIEKFNYLISSLRGEPLSLVQCTPMTADNYSIAYDSLVKRYQNKRLIALAHWNAIDTAPKLFDSHTTSQLRNLLNIFTENLSALNCLEVPLLDFILFNILFKRLDSNTRTRFELSHSSIGVPTFEMLKEFLLSQCNALDTASFTPQKSPKADNSRNNNFYKINYSQKSNSTLLADTNSCPFCKLPHRIYSCPKFLAKTPQQRYDIARQNKWCFNCLGDKHSIVNCTSKNTCHECHKKHHSLLHFQTNSQPAQIERNSSNSRVFDNNIENPQTSTSANTACSPQNSTILLATAVVNLLDGFGNYQPVRALLDSGSQLNFISEHCAKKLKLPLRYCSLSISGIGQNISNSTKITNCTVRPCDNSCPKFDLEAVILPKICNKMPNHSLIQNTWSHLSNLKLADPHYYTPGDIDILLGADIVALISKPGIIRGEENSPTALETEFGWVLIGKIYCNFNSHSNSLFCSQTPLEITLKKFWELENIPHTSKSKPEDDKCENLFVENVKRDKSGRYIVKLPFREAEPHFENSRSTAIRRFFSLERRLLADPHLHKQYSEFLQDYLQNQHMSPAPESKDNTKVYYIPHHCVLRPDSTTTKLRVVFDASAKTQNLSLNDTLLIGPKLQTDIVSILLKFRFYKFVLTADIKQMYRQILVASEHRNYQRIIWRFSPSESLQEFQLNTVTYGVSSAPYLAIRTLIHLAQNNSNKYPLASKVLQSDTYVDDIVTGTHNYDDAFLLKSQLIKLLASGGFELRKWASNEPSLLSDLPETHLQHSSLSLDLESDNFIKVLGLQWHPSSDSFTYSVKSSNLPCTKRSILSQIARIYDPLGFLSPLTFFAKYLMQHLWSLGIDWDETPPSDIISRWNQYNFELNELSKLSIPRQVFSFNCKLQVHGFCDASERGYSAVIYFRIVENNSEINTYIICAKTKVSPLKIVSIPRLELCAAVLLSDLFEVVLNAYKPQLEFAELYAWSDSQVALAWIKSSPHKWNTFVANRVSHIQEKLSPHIFNYISSSENPADCASRGLLPNELVCHALWWVGPNWLKLPQSMWPQVNVKCNSLDSEQLEEKRKNITLLGEAQIHLLDTLIEKYSCLSKLQRVLTYITRFIFNLRNPENRKVGPLTIIELKTSLFILIKHVQNIEFAQEINLLNHKKFVKKPLRKLSPFLDPRGILRVGGRLINSQLSYDKKFPALLPKTHRLTTLIIENTHKQYLHPGAQTLHFLLIQNFWIISAKRVIQSVISKCHICWRLNPRSLQPPMGNLPAVRISQVKCFSSVGVDYAGPFHITLSKTRGAKTHKSYICLFVCLCSKAIHLELASDLSTDAFLCALRRFVARRGRCSHIYSDQGTNFVGAYKELNRYMQEAASKEIIEWHFNLPSAPHFGGIWEAGVKSAKSHLSRIIGEQTLSYEEFYTVLTQIEAVLNSRPLCSVSSDPNDFSVLTPGHFLTLEPLTCLPSPDLTDIKTGRLSRWQLLQRFHQDFWNRWHKEYLNTLQQRSKWLEPSQPIVPGTLVLIKNDLVPPLQWHMARVISLHPGSDGISRVVTLRTPQGTMQRPIVKICPLPSQ